MAAQVLGRPEKAVLFHTVLPSMATLLETELGAKLSAWSSLAYIHVMLQVFTDFITSHIVKGGKSQYE